MKVLHILFVLFCFTGCCKKRFNSSCTCNVRTERESRICYTSGTFDMFHVGHLNLLRNASGICDKLIVGVHPDDVVFKNKNKYPVIPLEQRMEIIRALKFVDAVIAEPEYDYTKDQVNKLKVNTLVIGDDYVDKYKILEPKMALDGVKMVFLPYTKSQSSTKIRESLKASGKK